MSKKLLEAYPILEFFEYGHLPEHMQVISKPFCLLAKKTARDRPACAETSAALRKLLEAKDCAVRAGLTTPAVAPTIEG